MFPRRSTSKIRGIDGRNAGLVIRGHHAGEPEHDAEILEVGKRGKPPFVVRWEEDGRVSRYYPGSDAYVERFEHS